MPTTTELVNAIQALTSDVSWRERALKRLLAVEAIDENFTFVPNIEQGLYTPTFDIGASARPFSTTWTGADSQVLGVRKLELKAAKIEQIVDPNVYEAWFRTMALKDAIDPNDTEGLAQYIMDVIIMREAQVIRNQIIWQGEYNGAGTTPVAVCDGFAKIIADAITASAWTPVTTGTLTTANTYDAVNTVANGVNYKYRKLQDMMVRVSATVFQWYIDGYKAEHNGAEPTYITRAAMTNGVDGGASSNTRQAGQRVVGCYLTGAFAGIPLMIEDSMTEANSKMILATPKSNLQVGSNLSSFENIDIDLIRKEHNVLNIFGKYRIGCAIYESGQGAIMTSIES